MASRMTSTRARIKLRRILKESTDHIKPVMKESADTLRDEIKSNINDDSGNLSGLITSFVAKNGLRAEAGLRGKKAKKKGFYLRFLEMGTKSHKIAAYDSEVLSSGKNTYGKNMNHPGIPARPALQPAWDKHKPRILKDVGKAIEEAVKEAQKL